MKCKKCQHELFNIKEMSDCDDCENNGAYDEDHDIVYDQTEIIRLKLTRDEVEDGGQCKLGPCHGLGCHIYVCAKCGSKIMWPSIEG